MGADDFGVASYPEPSRATERWAENLDAYQASERLERADREQERAMLDAGWRMIGKEWTEPPRRRRSVEQVGALVRKAVMRLDPPRHPPGMPRGISMAMVGIFEALGDLMFYETATEALAKGKPIRRGRQDPLRAHFRGTEDVIRRGTESPAHRSIGAGPQSYAIAESRGRTHARWDEVKCSGTHVGAGTVKGLHAVEMAIDAQRAVIGAGVSELDLAGVRDWIADKADRAERVRLYRLRLAAERGAAVMGILSDAAVQRATADLTDKAILERIKRARVALERRMVALPERAEEMAARTGDMSFLAPLAALRKEAGKPKRGRAQEQEREPVAPVRSPLPRWL